MTGESKRIASNPTKSKQPQAAEVKAGKRETADYDYDYEDEREVSLWLAQG